MSLRRIVPLLLCAIALHPTDASSAAPTSRQSPMPRRATLRAQSIDNTQRIDFNHISMAVTNTGSIAYDKIAGDAGLEFPNASGKTAVFAAGPWMGATVNGQTRVAISDYSDEFGPGAMFGTIPDDPNKPEYKVYKLDRLYPNSADRDAALADYNAGAVPHGAPGVTVQGDGSLNIQGDQMLWCIFNDADFAMHINGAGNTQPLGVEVQLTAFAYASLGPAGNTIFLRYKVINKGGYTLQNFYVGMWSDPDLGGFTDDLVGCDPSRSLGYVYNATNNDLVYGGRPPALGIDVIQGPVGAGGAPLPMTAFTKYLNGQDPRSFSDTYNTLRGLNNDGTPIIDPVTLLPTTFEVSGDPIGQTGWLDTTPSDRRMLVSSGPITFLPGQTQELTYAIVIGQGTDRFDSIRQLLCADDQMQIFASLGYPLPPPPTCNSTTATLISLMSADAQPDRVTLQWFQGGTPSAQMRVERREGQADWLSMSQVQPDGRNMIEYQDTHITPGATYDYRLHWTDASGEQFAGETSVTVPLGAMLSLEGFRPNPAGRNAQISFSLADASAANISVFDIAGRRRLSREVGALGAGFHLVPLAGEIGSGLYVVRLTQGGRTLTRKAMIVR